MTAPHRAHTGSSEEVAMGWMVTLHRRLDDGRWRPYAISAATTALVAAVYTGAFDAVFVPLNWLQGA
jgi:hypothetical protein